MRRPVVTMTLVPRRCSHCHRVGLDVVVGLDGVHRCFTGLTCKPASTRAA